MTCGPCPCLLRFSRQSRPSRLSQGSAIAAEVFMDNVGSGQQGHNCCRYAASSQPWEGNALFLLFLLSDGGEAWWFLSVCAVFSPAFVFPVSLSEEITALNLISWLA